MLNLNNLMNNPEIILGEQKGPFQVLEWKHDMRIDPSNALNIFYLQKLGQRWLPKRNRQLLCALGEDYPSIILQAGAMQWFAGDIQQTTGLSGVGDFLKKSIVGKATGESAIKPQYTGDGLLLCEPNTKYLLIENLADWPSGLVVSDGMFLAAEASTKLHADVRKNLSSAIAGKEGLVNLCMKGKGYAVLESPVPRDDLIEIVLDNDVIRIDGDMAICWEASLSFSVERSGKSLVGSAASGEGLVNVYRGSGRLWMLPFRS